MAYYLYKKYYARQARIGNLETQKIEPPAAASKTTLHDDPDVDGYVSNDKPETKNEEALRDRAREKEMRTYRWRLMTGLAFPALVFALNTTMIAGALPFMASDFNEFSQLNWIVAAYNLTSAAFIPVWGQMANIFGRYPTFQAASLVMLLGSALCAASPTSNWPMLLAGRGIQGAGAAGILILEKIMLADKVSLKDNAVNNTLFTLVSSIGYGVGPVTGGYLTIASWRWVFIINIPLLLIGVLLTHLITRKSLLGPQDLPTISTTSPAFLARLSIIDFPSQLLFLLSTALLVLSLTWAGQSYPWPSVHVLAPLIIGTLLLALFILWTYLLQRPFPHRPSLQKSFFTNITPMLPLPLLLSRNASCLTYINLITGMAMYAVLYFSDLYFNLVLSFSASQSGTALLYYTPGLGLGALLAMLTCNIFPRKTWWPLFLGTLMEALGVTLLACAMRWGHLPTVYGMLGLTGVGTAIRLMPNTLHGVGYYRRHIAEIVSLMSVAHAFGGTLASTIMQNVFNNLMQRAGVDLGGSSLQSFSTGLEHLPPGERSYVQERARDSIVVAFLAITAFLWLGIVAVAFMGNVDIQRDSLVEDMVGGETDPGSLTKGSYLGHLLRWRR